MTAKRRRRGVRGDSCGVITSAVAISSLYYSCVFLQSTDQLVQSIQYLVVICPLGILFSSPESDGLEL